jgi:hypothetical protein
MVQSKSPEKAFGIDALVVCHRIGDNSVVIRAYVGKNMTWLGPGLDEPHAVARMAVDGPRTRDTARPRQSHRAQRALP